MIRVRHASAAARRAAPALAAPAPVALVRVAMAAFLAAAAAAVVALAAAAAPGDDVVAPDPGVRLEVREVLIRELPPRTTSGVASDPVELAVARGAWTLPRPGVPDADGVVWRALAADAEGWIRDDALPLAYAAAAVVVERDTTLILDAMGYRGVYVNGEPRVGNLYGATDTFASWEPRFDYGRLPVRLRAGENSLLFFGNRHGALRARFEAPRAKLVLNARDVTLPDLVVGERADMWGAIVVMNATGEVVTDAALRVMVPGAAPRDVPAPPLPPYGVRKVAFPLVLDAPDRPGPRPLAVAVMRAGRALDAATLTLAAVVPGANRRVTFPSAIDGSIQYYGLLPATGQPGPHALVLSLHGASVEAINQSGSYAPLSWAHVVAPTNRRPFGFNWEDWGRQDALEVLDLARRDLDVDDDRVYLTGHSMGGHGSWHVATLHPDRFAAVGPSAGWVSFWSYRPDIAAAPADPLAALLARGTLPSRTLETAPNLAGLGVYVLHGADDDVVPVAEARAMQARLAEFHADVDGHEEPGAGHWWDVSPEPGADCVSWPPMFDFFARHRRPRPAEVREVRFLTPSPAVSAWRDWVCVAAQERPFVMSEVDARLEPVGGRLTASTRNVAALGLAVGFAAGDTLTAALDGDTLTVAVPPDGVAWFARAGRWRPAGAPDPAERGMVRGGGMREAYGNRVQLVYATGGDPAEDAWALARARYDAEHLWYQGNASLDVLPDTLYDPAAEPDRNVILYGNADTHRRWRALWPATDLTAARGRVVVGERVLRGDGVGLLAVRPRPGSDRAMVGVVSGSGLPGLRLTDRSPVLSPGVAWPDVTVLEDLGDGTVVRGAGFLGAGWRVSGGEFAWAGSGP